MGDRSPRIFSLPLMLLMTLKASHELRRARDQAPFTVLGPFSSGLRPENQHGSCFRRIPDREASDPVVGAGLVGC